MNHLLFVYGTLKRGCCNHAQMAGQEFIGPIRTVPGYTLYDLGGYPAIAPDETDKLGVAGEIWRVNEAGLHRLDLFEGVHEGLYQRKRIALQAPFAEQEIDAYFSVVPLTGRSHVGAEWIESPERSS